MTHQSQGATLSDSELIRLEQRGQSGRSEKLDTIEVHNHNARHGELRDQRVGQFQPGRAGYLAHYRDHPDFRSVLGRSQAGVGGKAAACRHTRNSIVHVMAQRHAIGSELLSGAFQSVCGTARPKS